MVQLEAWLPREAHLQHHPVLSYSQDVTDADIALVHPPCHEVLAKAAGLETWGCLGVLLLPLGVV
jgi:hypothetical protein